MSHAFVEQPTQCRECPWRNLDDPALTDTVKNAARQGHQFVCHTRMSGCPGPRLAGLTTANESPQDKPKEAHCESRSSSTT